MIEMNFVKDAEDSPMATNLTNHLGVTLRSFSWLFSAHFKQDGQRGKKYLDMIIPHLRKDDKLIEKCNFTFDEEQLNFMDVVVQSAAYTAALEAARMIFDIIEDPKAKQSFIESCQFLEEVLEVTNEG